MGWQKTGKVCPGCDKLRSARFFIAELPRCAHCSFDDEIFKSYKKCVHCLGLFKKEEMDHGEGKATCEKCLKIKREKYHEFKSKGKLDKNKKHICKVCSRALSPISFPRGSDPENLCCKHCIKLKKIEEEGCFKCANCRSVFPKEECYWNKFCFKCCERRKKDNRERMRKLYKIPEWKEYMNAYSRWYRCNILKVIYNKIFTLQWEWGLLKPRKVNRNGYWYVLNRSLFHEFKTRPAKCFSIQNKIIEFMRTGRGRIVGDTVILDSRESRKKFDEYLDSYEAMAAPMKPKYEPEMRKVRDYFQPD
jgi:hypothetical protein